MYILKCVMHFRSSRNEFVTLKIYKITIHKNNIVLQIHNYEWFKKKNLPTVVKHILSKIKNIENNKNSEFCLKILQFKMIFIL